MRPGVVLLGFVLGSTASITFGLLGVVIVVLVLGREQPRLAEEFPFLLASLAAFAGLTALAAVSFYGELKARGWGRVATGVLLAALAVTGWAYWPAS